MYVVVVVVLFDISIISPVFSESLVGTYYLYICQKLIHPISITG